MQEPWTEIELSAWKALARRVESGDLDALKLFFDMRKKWLLTAPEVAEILGVSEQTVRHWVKAGEIKHIRFGWSNNSSLRFDPEDLKEFVSSRKLGLGWHVEGGPFGPNFWDDM